MSDTKTKSGRRHFLKTAAVASGAAAAGAVAGSAVADMAPDPATTTEAPRAQREGYRVTPHIETYYRLARD